MQKPKGRTFLQRALVAIALLSASCAPLAAQERANNLTFSHPMPPQTNMLPTAPDRAELLRDFKDPFGKVRTGAYWYWISGNSSREGVVKDLHAMKSIGIDRAFIGDIGQDDVVKGPTRFFSKDWWAIIHQALEPIRRPVGQARHGDALPRQERNPRSRPR